MEKLSDLQLAILFEALATQAEDGEFINPKIKQAEVELFQRVHELILSKREYQDLEEFRFIHKGLWNENNRKYH